MEQGGKFPMSKLRFRIGMMLAVLAMGLASESAFAQNYLCPAGAGPGERQIGMTEGGGNSGLASITAAQQDTVKTNISSGPSRGDAR